MTIPPVVRVFFAVDLPATIKDQVASYICQLKKKAKSNSIRWTKPENLHITLQFLAEVRSEHINALIENVRGNINSHTKHTRMKLGGIHLFPNPFRPRVIVLDIAPQEELAFLSRLIGEGIKATEYAIEDRPFRGHLTIGRIKQPQGLDLKFLAEVGQLDVEEIAVNEVVLFRSEPHSNGSKYSVLERLPLTSSGDG